MTTLSEHAASSMRPAPCALIADASRRDLVPSILEELRRAGITSGVVVDLLGDCPVPEGVRVGGSDARSAAEPSTVWVNAGNPHVASEILKEAAADAELGPAVLGPRMLVLIGPERVTSAAQVQLRDLLSRARSADILVLAITSDLQWLADGGHTLGVVRLPGARRRQRL